MKAILVFPIAVLLTAVVVSRSQGSDEWVFESVQPIWTENDITLSRVTVATFTSDAVGVVAVVATCDSNQVVTEYGPKQRNVAFEVGLRVSVAFNSERQWSLFGDTLRVTLRATKPSAGFEDFALTTIVAATVECIMANAAQSPEIKFVALRLEDKALNTRFGGVFKTDPFRRGPRKHVFTDTDP